MFYRHYSCFVAAAVLPLTADVAFSEMSKSSFSAARGAARHVGRLVASMEACNVIADKLKTRIVRKAEFCDASSDQIDKLESVMDDEQANSSSSECNFPDQTAAEDVLEKTVQKLDEAIEEGNCD